MSQPSQEIVIRIKSASHKYAEDMEFNISKKSTVKHVKELIRDSYPFHPEIQEQRLIYAGHILQDEQVFNDFLLPSTDQFTIASSDDGHKLESYVIHLSCTMSYTRREREATAPSSSDQLRQRTADSTATGNNPWLPSNSSGVGNGIGPEIPAGIPQDMAALHQMYLQQMLSFMTQWNTVASAGAGVPLVAGAGFQPHYQQHVHMQPPPMMNFPQQPMQQQPAVPPQPVPRVRDEDDAQQADMLDWIYTLSRVALIFSVVYFYSSFTRLVLVTVFTALIVMLQRRQRQVVAQNQRQNNNNNNGAPAPAADQANPNPNPAAADQQPAQRPEAEANQNLAPGNEQARPEPPAAAAGNNDEASAPNQEAPPQGADTTPAVAVAAEQERIQRATLWTFVSSFVTSLIPDMAQHN